MLFRTADQAFASFQRSGDPRALARVFDRTAPELAKLARHLASSEAAAEDLVQATFVTAIEAAATHRRGEPVLPWLVGILGNHARAARRKARRTLDAARAARDDTSDPLRETERRELHGQLGEAIDSLPEPYRPVLRLYLDQGLEPAEIARTLERPQGTVRAQVHRGLELLRAALPAALGAGVAFAAGPARGLDRVRAEVLARCGEHAGGAAAGVTVLGALTLMHTKWLFPAAIVAAAALSTWLFFGGGDPAGGAAQPPPSASLAADAPRPAAAPAAADPPPAAAERSALADAPPPAAPPSAAVVRVRVARVVGTQREPVAGIPVRLAPMDELQDPQAGSGPQRTDEHGVAVFPDVDPGNLRATVEHANASVFVQVAAGDDKEVRLVLAEGITAQGTVRDAAGQPVAGATVLVHVNRTEPDPIATSDEHGRYRVAHLAPHTALQARARGHAPSLGHRVQGQAGATLSLDLALQGRGRRLVGRVCRPDGQPAADTRVALVPPHPLPVPREAPFPFAMVVTTSDDGTFATDDAPASDLTVVAIPPRHSELVPGTAALAAGSEDAAIDVALRAGATLHGVVHGANRDRGPVFVHAWNERAAAALGYLGNLHGHRVVAAGADGTYRLRGLAPGTHEITVVQRQMLARHTVELTEGAEVEWNAHCGGDAPLRLVIAPPTPPPGAGAVWLVNLYRRGPGGGLQFRNSAAPDGRGRVSLQNADPAAGHDVVVLLPRGGNDHVVVAHLADLRPRREPYRLEIPATALPSAKLRGRLTDAHGSARANQKLVVRAGVSDVLVSTASTVTGADGSFDLGPLPPGTWTLHLGTQPGAPVLGRHELLPDQVLDVGQLLVR